MLKNPLFCILQLLIVDEAKNVLVCQTLTTCRVMKDTKRQHSIVSLIKLNNVKGNDVVKLRFLCLLVFNNVEAQVDHIVSYFVFETMVHVVLVGQFLGQLLLQLKFLATFFIRLI